MKLVITEKNTIEGFTAGWAAMRILGKFDPKKNPDGAKWLEVQPGGPLPDVAVLDVLMFGVCYPRQQMQYLSKKADSFRAFDNQLESKRNVGGLRYVKIQTNKTPARMAWDFLRGNISIFVKKQRIVLTSAPWIVDYTEDKKFWKWPAHSLYFIRLAIVEKYKPSLKSWDELAAKDLMVVESEGLAMAKELEAKKQEELKQKTLEEAKKESEKEDKKDDGKNRPTTVNQAGGSKTGGAKAQGGKAGAAGKPGKPKVPKSDTGKAQGPKV